MRFVDQYLNLTGLEVRDCVFDGCLLEVWRDRHTLIKDSFIVDCEFRGDWPEKFMRALAEANGKPFTFTSRI